MAMAGSWRAHSIVLTKFDFNFSKFGIENWWPVDGDGRIMASPLYCFN